jgi:MFS family permease
MKPQPDPVAQTPAGRGRAVALAVLTAVGTINFVDRQVLSVLVEPIRHDLHLSDTAFGFLTGLSFALFYAAVGVPAAMLADRTHRVRLVAAACLAWSVFTGMCGLATNFWQLAMARFGVGVGEAGGTAPSLSILADYYPPRQRPMVIGLFTANGPLGVFLGATFGGWVAERLGWRGAFFVVSLLGVLAAPILLMIVREPRRGAFDDLQTVDQARIGQAGFAVALRRFAGTPALMWLIVGSGLSAFVSYGMLNWIPAYLMRLQHMPLSAVEHWFGPAAGLCMGLGIWGGGALVNIASRRSMLAYAIVPGVAMLIASPAFALALLAPSWQISLALMTLPMVAVTIYVAPALALVQTLSPVSARATATAFLLLAFNIVGLGGGTLTVGALSDAFNHFGHADGLRLALLCLAPVSLLAAALYVGVAHALRAEHGAMSATK